ncbi:MAG: hypothetical protein ACI9JK_001620 [Phycisphaerales bacterium]|jgi:hypothetical protein
MGFLRNHKAKIGFCLLAFSFYSMVCIPLLVSVIFKDLTPEKIKVTRMNAKMMAYSLEKYILDTGLMLPEDDFQLANLLSYIDKDKNITKHPFLEADGLNDAWGNPFTIQFDATDKFKFDIISWGADETPSTSNTDLDIVYSHVLISKQLQQFKDWPEARKKDDQNLPELDEQ